VQVTWPRRAFVPPPVSVHIIILLYLRQTESYIVVECSSKPILLYAYYNIDGGREVQEEKLWETEETEKKLQKK